MSETFNLTHRIALDIDCDRLQFHNPQLPVSVINQLPGAIVEIIETCQSSSMVTVRALVDENLWRVDAPSVGIEPRRYS